MVNQAPEELTRQNINLFTTDVEYLKIHIGSGWTSTVRALVREYVNQLKVELNLENKR